MNNVSKLCLCVTSCTDIEADSSTSSFRARYQLSGELEFSYLTCVREAARPFCWTGNGDWLGEKCAISAATTSEAHLCAPPPASSPRLIGEHCSSNQSHIKQVCSHMHNIIRVQSLRCHLKITFKCDKYPPKMHVCSCMC